MNSTSVWVNNDEYKCTEVADGILISYGHRHLGKIMGEMIPRSGDEDEEWSKFRQVVEDWIIDNRYY